MSFQTHVFVGADGQLKFVYRDELVGLLALGTATIARASTVEPSPEGWFADLAASGGPVLGPFPLRSEAIDHEVEWLDQRMCTV